MNTLTRHSQLAKSFDNYEPDFCDMLTVQQRMDNMRTIILGAIDMYWEKHKHTLYNGMCLCLYNTFLTLLLLHVLLEFY